MIKFDQFLESGIDAEFCAGFGRKDQLRQIVNLGIADTNRFRAVRSALQTHQYQCLDILQGSQSKAEFIEQAVDIALEEGNSRFLSLLLKSYQLDGSDLEKTAQKAMALAVDHTWPGFQENVSIALSFLRLSVKQE